MGRKLFAERNFNVWGKVVPFADFKLLCDMPGGFHINETLHAPIIAQAENRLQQEIPQLHASEYMMFKRDGNRSIFEGRYFERRSIAFDLALAEHIEGKGRFLDKLIDVVWLILEETTWVLPAHNPSKEGVNTCLPYAYAGHVDYIDLFSAMSAAQLAVIYHLFHKKFDAVTSLINERLLYELNRRIVEPFMNDTDLLNKMMWSGLKGNRVNNWCPWIVSNVLTVCAFTVKDQALRTALVQRSLPMLDAFTAAYHDDGACDEGPGYWQAAGGALYNACVALYDLTNGYVNIYDAPLFKNMGEYAVKAVIHDKRVLSFADASSTGMPYPLLVYHWGLACDSKLMVDYALSRMNGKMPQNWGQGQYNWQPYRLLRFLSTPSLPSATYTPPQKFYFDGVAVAVTREIAAHGRGLYLAFKGGHNNESHNHNDLGGIVVYSDEDPLFIDVGVGTYTRRTFGKDRYTIWSMCSDYHNCATFNGVTQQHGGEYASNDEKYNEETGRLLMNLTTAYPKEAGLSAYHRSAVLENAKIVIEDDVVFQTEGNVMFSYMVTKEPEEVGEGYFVLYGRRVSFDASLVYRIEEVPCTEPEVARIPKLWETDAIRRITLSSRSPVKDKKYVMTID